MAGAEVTDDTTLPPSLLAWGRGWVAAERPQHANAPTHIAGLGCRKDTTPEELVALIQKAATQAGVTLNALATPSFKQHEQALKQAAARLNLPLLYIEEAALKKAQPLCPTSSEAAHRATGLHSIAEAAALAATAGHLLAPRIASKNATCAIARIPEE